MLQLFLEKYFQHLKCFLVCLKCFGKLTEVLYFLVPYFPYRPKPYVCFSEFQFFINFVFRDLKTTRARFLTALTDPGNSIATIEAAANQYISLLQGLCCDVGGQGESQLKKCVNFKWTNSIGGNEIW